MRYGDIELLSMNLQYINYRNNLGKYNFTFHALYTIILLDDWFLILN